MPSIILKALPCMPILISRLPNTASGPPVITHALTDFNQHGMETVVVGALLLRTVVIRQERGLSLA